MATRPEVSLGGLFSKTSENWKVLASIQFRAQRQWPRPRGTGSTGW